MFNHIALLLFIVGSAIGYGCDALVYRRMPKDVGSVGYIVSIFMMGLAMYLFAAFI